MRRAFAFHDRVELLQHVVPVAWRARYVGHVAANVVCQVVNLFVRNHLLDLVDCLISVSWILLQVYVALRDGSMPVEYVVSPQNEARMRCEPADVAEFAIDSFLLGIFDEMADLADETLLAAVLEDAEWITIAVWEQRREGHCCQPRCFELVEWHI